MAVKRGDVSLSLSKTYARGKWFDKLTMTCTPASEFTHPDYTAFVDPLCFAKRVRRKAKPSLRAAKRGWSSGVKTG